MKGVLRSRAALLVLLLAAIAAGYLGFRFFYGIAGDFPFSQELLLVFIGAIATVLITALLLNQQTELELRKEGQVLLLNQKSGIYQALIEHIGEVVERGRMDAVELAELRILNHKLAMIGSALVIRHFNDVLQRLDSAIADGGFDEAEQDRIMRAVAVLTYYMRRDLLGRVEDEDDDAVLRDILANNAGLQGEEGG